MANGPISSKKMSLRQNDRPVVRRVLGRSTDLSEDRGNVELLLLSEAHRTHARTRVT